VPQRANPLTTDLDYYPSSPLSNQGDKHASIPPPAPSSPSPSVRGHSFISVPRDPNRYAFHRGHCFSTAPDRRASLPLRLRTNGWRVCDMAYT
jgi:hypothetical protein